MIKSLILASFIALALSITADNVCTFHVGDRFFSLIYLEKATPYQLPTDEDDTKIVYNFCQSFVPHSCSNQDIEPAYVFKVQKEQVVLEPDSHHQNMTDSQIIEEANNNEESNGESIKQNEENQDGNPQNDEQKEKQNQGQSSQTDDQDQPATQVYKCDRFSSNSFSYYFHPQFSKENGKGTLRLILTTQKNNVVSRKRTQFKITCSNDQDFILEKTDIDDDSILIQGKSKYGCPVFQVSSLWVVIDENPLIFGIILFVIGVQSLFFGRITIEISLFFAAFFICLLILGAILTVFIGPNSSTVTIYFSFLLLLAIATLISYGITKLVDISLFFIGAWFGLIVGILVNSIFSKIFDVYSVWSLVIFVILFGIPFGLLTFKFRDELIISSTSLTGAYLVVRPISWIFGGFPNEFLLYHLIQTNQLDTLPWPFFLYLVFIIALAIIGGMYQILKLHRESPMDQIEINYIQQNIERPLDIFKETVVDGIIERIKSDNQSPDKYDKMDQMRMNEKR